MAFRIQKDAKRWFKDIAGGDALPLDFDIWYLCLMVGLAAQTKNTNVLVAETNELVAYFPGKYASRGRLIVAAFLARELSRMGIRLSERQAVHEAIASLVSPSSPSHLSDVGMRDINAYSYGGFDRLAASFDDRPRTVDSFLPMYQRVLDDSLAQRSASQPSN